MINLKAVEKSDLEKFRQWRNNPQLIQYFRQYHPLTVKDQDDWYELIHNDDSVLMFAITENGKAIGTCGLTNIDWKNRTAEISIFIGNSYVDRRAKGALYLLRTYAFDTLGLYRLYAEVYEFDTMKYELLVQGGFFKEGVLKEHVFHGGRRYDSIILGMTK